MPSLMPMHDKMQTAFQPQTPQRRAIRQQSCVVREDPIVDDALPLYGKPVSVFSLAYILNPAPDLTPPSEMARSPTQTETVEVTATLTSPNPELDRLPRLKLPSIREDFPTIIPGLDYWKGTQRLPPIRTLFPSITFPTAYPPVLDADTRCGSETVRDYLQSRRLHPISPTQIDFEPTDTGMRREHEQGLDWATVLDRARRAYSDPATHLPAVIPRFDAAWDDVENWESYRSLLYQDMDDFLTAVWDRESDWASPSLKRSASWGDDDDEGEAGGARKRRRRYWD